MRHPTGNHQVLPPPLLWPDCRQTAVLSLDLTLLWASFFPRFAFSFLFLSLSPSLLLLSVSRPHSPSLSPSLPLPLPPSLPLFSFPSFLPSFLSSFLRPHFLVLLLSRLYLSLTPQCGPINPRRADPRVETASKRGKEEKGMSGDERKIAERMLMTELKELEKENWVRAEVD